MEKVEGVNREKGQGQKGTDTKTFGKRWSHSPPRKPLPRGLSIRLAPLNRVFRCFNTREIFSPASLLPFAPTPPLLVFHESNEAR